MKAHILLVDDEQALTDLLSVYLENDGFVVHSCASGSEALRILEKAPIALAILDVMLPDMSGFDICRHIRTSHFFPVIMLTAKIDAGDKIFGLTVGADDYITKPFNPLEVVARVKTQLRRAREYNQPERKPRDEIDIRGLVINNSRHRCTLYGEEITLTPLSSVIGYLTLLADEPSLPVEARQRYLRTTCAKAERLDGLINEFFEITRFNLAHMPLEYHTIDGARLLEQLVFEFQPQLAEKNLHCDLHAPETLSLCCDPDKLQRVFDNLLRNAVLYSDPDTTLTIVVRKEPTNAVFTFTNAGATIPPERLAHLFDQFFRLDTARSSSGGAGLGLAIARQIVRQHGGDITAASASGTVTFTVTLPFDQP
ncbi:MAG: response regulator [Peptococcaceae bacterium]|nr:response regulator [Peptococcaceae bacterium]